MIDFRVFLLLALVSIFSAASTARPKKKESPPCPPFPHVSLENGRISRYGPQKYAFKCNPGYLLVSPPVVRCHRGEWSSPKKPTCIKAEGLCSDPEPIEGGKVLGDNREVGSTIQYQCDDGFVLLGEGSRECLRSGHWSGITPACMDESESVSKVAERLKKSFVNDMGLYSEDSKIRPQGRLLDPDSVVHGLELIILLDRSSSVDPEDFKIGVNFIKFLLQEFGVRNGNNNTLGTRAAVLTFGSKVDILFDLDNETINGPVAANRALNTLKPGGGGTAMMEAFLDVMTKVAERRPLAKKALFMLTDGEPNVGSVEDTVQLAKQIRDGRGVEMFTVGIGRGINRKVLSEIASAPLINHVFILDKYADLSKIMQAIKEKPAPPKPISSSQCGYVRNPNNYLKLWPWQASLYVGLPEPKRATRLGFCAGTLVCEQWVLTAASCFYDIQWVNGTERQVDETKSEVFVSLGDRNVIQDDRNQLNFYAQRIVVHPEFQPLSDLRHNLALVRLNRPAPMRRFRPACLPPTDRPNLLHKDLTVKASIAGWGLPPSLSTPGDRTITRGTVELQLSNVTVDIEEDKKCEDASGPVAKESVFCAGAVGYLTCVGDLGSPIIAVDPHTNLHHLIGVLSGRSHCERGINQYADISRYIEWINSVTDQCPLAHQTNH